MKVVTWNVNSLRARMPRVLEFLDQHSPDALLLQETKCSPEQFPADELLDAGYEAVHHSGGRWAGVAVLAPKGHGLEEVQSGLPGEARAEQARWIEARVEATGVTVASVYVVNGREVGSEPFAEKLQFLEALADRVSALREERLVVGGDFNVAPADLDVWDPAAWEGSTHVTGDERTRLAAVEETGGLVDCFRALHPEEQGFTWWDYRGGSFHRGMGLRIDLLLASEPLVQRLEACGIERDFRKGPKPSDHAPLMARFSG
ncbi:MAG: exodeoxyribonuclease III [Solirubrobacterales bacterium]